MGAGPPISYKSESASIGPKKTQADKGTTAQGTAAVKPPSVKAFADSVQSKPGEWAKSRAYLVQEVFANLDSLKTNEADSDRILVQGQQRWVNGGQANAALKKGNKEEVQTGKLGVELSLDSSRLRTEERLTPTALKRVLGRRCMEVCGVWIDEGYDPKAKSVVVKAMSPAYFRILERHPEVRHLYRLGNALVWVTPSATTLILDAGAGRQELTDAEIDALFTARK
jgi:hypothetical protein